MNPRPDYTILDPRLPKPIPLEVERPEEIPSNTSNIPYDPKICPYFRKHLCSEGDNKEPLELI